MSIYRENLEERQKELLVKGNDIFGNARGNGKFKIRGKQKPYPHILEEDKEWNNLFPSIRDNVKSYFKKNNISFWNGTTITGNTLSSQVSCLNHLFLIRNNEEAVRCVMQAFVGNRFVIDFMVKVEPKCEKYDQQYIAFEMVSDEDRMNEGKLTRGNTCTSIDAFAIAHDKSGKKRIIVIEWKLVEDDSGNKAPTEATSKNIEEIQRGRTRVNNYGELINNSKAIIPIDNRESLFNSSLFHLPFYELMRQTLWAENNKVDFGADDYIHVNVIPMDNPMRSKRYKCIDNKKGIVEGWRQHLTDYGNERYIDADPYLVVKALEDNHRKKYLELLDYLKVRYYFG